MNQKTLIGLLALALLTCLLPDPAGAQSLGQGFKLKYQEMKRDGSNGAATVALPGSLTVAGNASVTGAVEVMGVPTIGGTAVSRTAGLDIWNGGNSIMLGGDVYANTRTNSTAKLGDICFPHFTNAEAPILGFLCYTPDAANNNIGFGGGSNAYNSATKLSFYTAPSGTSKAGTARFEIGSTGAASFSGQLNVAAPIISSGTTPQFALGQGGSLHVVHSLSATRSYDITVGGGAPAISVASDTKIVTFGSVNLTPQADPPSVAAEGQVYADTDHHMYYYNGTSWLQLDNAP